MQSTGLLPVNLAPYNQFTQYHSDREPTRSIQQGLFWVEVEEQRANPILKRTRKKAHVDKTVCAWCGVAEALEWRRGPSGERDLCNPCGLRYGRMNKLKQAAAKRDAIDDSFISGTDGEPSSKLTSTSGSRRDQYERRTKRKAAHIPNQPTPEYEKGLLGTLQEGKRERKKATMEKTELVWIDCGVNNTPDMAR